MECLQYKIIKSFFKLFYLSFKPCYKWNAFNTSFKASEKEGIIKF